MTGRDERIAAVQRELAQLEALDEATRLPARSLSRAEAPTVVYSLRLDPDEVTALEARAVSVGIRPRVLARNLIRVGLSSRYESEVSVAVQRVEDAVRELRSLVP